MLDKGVSVDEKNNKGQTPIIITLSDETTEPMQKKVDMVKYLTKKGATIDAQTIDLAKFKCPDALTIFEHPEELPSLEQLELSLIGNFSYEGIVI